MLISDLNLVQTSAACPEQYNVVDKFGTVVGYFRLRHGLFTAQLYGPSGPEVYSVETQGDGIFNWHEREFHLNAALARLAAAL